MTDAKKFDKRLKSNSSKDYVSREEFFKVVDYLLLNQLNAQTSLQTGSESNKKLRELFLNLIAILKPTIFCDIGSRDGESATDVNHLLPKCECYAFEANPKIYQQFYSKLAEVSPYVNYLNLAIGDVNCSVKLFTPKTITKAVVEDEIIEVNLLEPEDSGRTSLLQRNEDTVSYEEFEVQCFTLDQYWMEQQVDVTQQRLALWIDVEGAADKVLLGASQSLKQTAIVFIEVEGIEFWQQQKQGHEIARYLIRQGFIPIARDREYYDKQFNLLFIKQEHLEVVYPALFNLKNSLNSTKIIFEIRELQERLNTVENFIDESIEEYLASALSEQEEHNKEVGGQKDNFFIPIFSSNYPRCDLPIYIPCFNNLTYLRNMIEQLHQVGCSNVFVLDNTSTYPPLLQYLQEIETVVTVVRLSENYGPHCVFLDDLLYSLLPPYFCLTDPDLIFNPSLPSDFMNQLLQLTEEFKVGKAGFALDISQQELMVEEEFLVAGKSYKIWEWESQFWQQPLRENIYKASLDTTFAVYNKKYFNRPFHTMNAIRVAGNLTCQHLPWYRKNFLPRDEEEFYRETSRYSYYLKGIQKTSKIEPDTETD
jgi:FkbM family methyltransferase